MDRWFPAGIMALVGSVPGTSDPLRKWRSTSGLFSIDLYISYCEAARTLGHIDLLI